jgi:hypothetical protein
MTVEVHADRYVAENVERVAILREGPRWNVLKAHPSPRVADEEIAGTGPASRRGSPPWERPEAERTRTPKLTGRRASSREQSQEAVWRALSAACATAGKPVLGRDVVNRIGLGDDLVRLRLGELVELGRVVRHNRSGQRWYRWEAIGEPADMMPAKYGRAIPSPLSEPATPSWFRRFRSRFMEPGKNERRPSLPPPSQRHQTEAESIESVFDALTALGRPASCSQVAERVGRSPQLTRQRLAQLVKQGRVHRSGNAPRWTRYAPVAEPPNAPSDATLLPADAPPTTTL